MKAVIQCLIISLIFVITSCSTTEEIWINKDQTVKREVKMDLSAIVPFMKMGDAFKEAEEEEESDEYNPEDEMDRQVEQGGEEKESTEDKMDKFMDDLFKRDYVDTLIDMKSIMMEEMKKQGVSEEEFWEGLAESEMDDMSESEKEGMMEMFQSLMNSKIRIKMDTPNDVYFFSMIQDFENPKELNAGANILNSLSSIMGDEIGGSAADPEQAAMMKMMMGGTPVYDLGKKEFNITRAPLDMSDLPEEMKSTLQMMSAFMGGMDYKYVIHVPKKVKKVNINGAVIEGNTVTIDVPMPSIGKKDAGLDLKIKYK